MHIAGRPRAAGAVAFVSAAAIAVTPIAPQLPQVHLPSIRTAEVALSAATNPLFQLISTTADNLAGLGVVFYNEGNSAPILSQFVSNQTANINNLVSALTAGVGATVQTVTAIPQNLILAAQQIAAGNVKDAIVNTIWGNIILASALGFAVPLISVATIVRNTVDNFAKVVDALDDNLLLPLGLSLIYPIAAVVDQFGTDAQAFSDALRAGDATAALTALLNAPISLINAFLNGTEASAGLLTPGTGAYDAGPISTLLRFRNTIAAAMTFPVSTTAAKETSESSTGGTTDPGTATDPGTVVVVDPVVKDPVVVDPAVKEPVVTDPTEPVKVVVEDPTDPTDPYTVVTKDVVTADPTKDVYTTVVVVKDTDVTAKDYTEVKTVTETATKVEVIKDTDTNYTYTVAEKDSTVKDPTVTTSSSKPSLNLKNKIGRATQLSANVAALAATKVTAKNSSGSTVQKRGLSNVGVHQLAAARKGSSASASK
ncbi:MAG TPA: hypothetical protein VFW21_07860 [Mycobacterium sp.]|nr:hypothetical protein [Mycobacterium sp.]